MQFSFSLLKTGVKAIFKIKYLVIIASRCTYRSSNFEVCMNPSLRWMVLLTSAAGGAPDARAGDNRLATKYSKWLVIYATTCIVTIGCQISLAPPPLDQTKNHPDLICCILKAILVRITVASIMLCYAMIFCIWN